MLGLAPVNSICCKSNELSGRRVLTTSIEMHHHRYQQWHHTIKACIVADLSIHIKASGRHHLPQSLLHISLLIHELQVRT